MFVSKGTDVELTAFCAYSCEHFFMLYFIHQAQMVDATVFVLDVVVVYLT